MKMAFSTQYGPTIHWVLIVLRQKIGKCKGCEDAATKIETAYNQCNQQIPLEK